MAPSSLAVNHHTHSVKNIVWAARHHMAFTASAAEHDWYCTHESDIVDGPIRHRMHSLRRHLHSALLSPACHIGALSGCEHIGQLPVCCDDRNHARHKGSYLNNVNQVICCTVFLEENISIVDLVFLPQHIRIETN